MPALQVYISDKDYIRICQKFPKRTEFSKFITEILNKPDEVVIKPQADIKKPEEIGGVISPISNKRCKHNRCLLELGHNGKHQLGME